MAFQSSKQARVYIGSLAAAAYARTAASTSTTEMHDVSTLVDTSKQMVPGNDTGTFNLDGPMDLDASANGQMDTLTTQKTAASTAVTYLPLGTTAVTTRCWLIDTVQTQLDTDSSHSGTVDWTLAAQTTGRTDFAGKVLEDNTTVTVDTDGTTHNNGAGSTQGAVYHLHVTAFSGLTSDAIIIEGSTTGSWGGEETTVATFASVTGLTSERVEVTGSVPRYTRVVDDVLGVGSITRFVAASRR